MSDDREQATMSGSFTGKRRGDHINIPRSEVLAGIGGYPQQDQEDLLWLFGYTIEQLHGSRSALKAELRSDWSTIWRVWAGKYGASIANFMDRVRAMRRKAETGSKTRFIDTPVTERIHALCDVSRDNGAIVMISGPSGRSKTWAVEEWKNRNNHGRAIYVDCPDSGGFRTFCEALAKQLCVGCNTNVYDIAATVRKSIDYRNVIILDEVSRLLPRGRANNLTSLEFVRRLHDTTGCGVVLVATDIFPAQMENGIWSKWFEQLLGRCEFHLRIPKDVLRAEAAAICAAYVDDPDSDLINLFLRIANHERGALRVPFRLLKRASELAHDMGQPLSAQHLMESYKWQQNLSKIKED